MTHETFKALKPGLSAYADDVEKVTTTILCVFLLPMSFGFLANPFETGSVGHLLRERHCLRNAVSWMTERWGEMQGADMRP